MSDFHSHPPIPRALTAFPVYTSPPRPPIQPFCYPAHLLPNASLIHLVGHNTSGRSAARRRAHRQNPHCVWCGQVTIGGGQSAWRPQGPIAPALATIDHLVPAYLRLPHHRQQGVLACQACNTLRSLLADMAYRPYVATARQLQSARNAYTKALARQQLSLREGRSVPNPSLLHHELVLAFARVVKNRDAVALSLLAASESSYARLQVLTPRTRPALRI